MLKFLTGMHPRCTRFHCFAGMGHSLEKHNKGEKEMQGKFKLEGLKENLGPESLKDNLPETLGKLEDFIELIDQRGRPRNPCWSPGPHAEVFSRRPGSTDDNTGRVHLHREGPRKWH